MISKEQAWLLLTRIKGLGSVRISTLINHFGSAENIFNEGNIPEHLKLPSQVRSDLNNPQLNTIKDDLLWLDKNNNHLLCFDDPIYPPLLKQTPNHPSVLFITGNPNLLLQPQLAVVGSRNASAIGLRNTTSFCSDLARNGLTITSGMALGVDGNAHKAALNVGGNTIAVMGTGLDVVYPARHQKLAHQIAENGALVSEFPTGTKPHAYHFPRRNRIICGLSLGTLVVEASIQSGTLITARLTMEINRPVMAIPGSIHSPMAKGCHLLIKQGAKLVESAQEIIEDITPLAHSLSLQIKENLAKLENKTFNSDDNHYIKSETNSDHELILSHVMHDPTAIDEIISNSGLRVQEVSSILLILELEDKIQALPGAQYIRI